MNNIARIQEKLRESKLDAILITDSLNQRYATGFSFTDGAVLVSTDHAWLFADSRYIEAAAAEAEGVEVRLFSVDKPLSGMLKEVIKENNIQALAIEEHKLNYAQYVLCQKTLNMELKLSNQLIETLRAVKSEDEIKCLRQAQAISESALVDVLKLIKPGMTERDVAAELVYRMIRYGADGLSFDPIVVSGPNTSLPHGTPSDRMIMPGDFVTIDFGCIKNGYCSDTTRTVAIGLITDDMCNVYDTVLEAQLAGIAAAKAGITGKEVDAAARKIINEAGYGQYFGHSLGHSVGLGIHEGPNFSPRNEEILPANAVLSVEPGIYIPGRFGVRIEDVVILNENGCEVMTKAPKALLIL